MSHFATYKANVSSQKYLVKALKEMGYEVELNSTIKDYYGANQTVQVAVAGKPLGFSWNKEQKKYDVIADWWGTGIREKDFCNLVSQLHEKYKVTDICKSKGLKVNKWTKLKDGSIQMVATESIY